VFWEISSTQCLHLHVSADYKAVCSDSMRSTPQRLPNKFAAKTDERVFDERNATPRPLVSSNTCVSSYVVSYFGTWRVHWCTAWQFYTTLWSPHGWVYWNPWFWNFQGILNKRIKQSLPGAFPSTCIQGVANAVRYLMTHIGQVYTRRGHEAQGRVKVI